MKSLKTPAIVLRRTNYGEADRILQLLTPDGKKSVIAKSVRKEKSRLAGGIELFAVCDVVIGEGKGELGLLTSARLGYFFKNIMTDYDRMQFGYQVIKLINSASEMVSEPEWYDVLVEVLGGLDASSVPLPVTQAWFYLKYASLMGYELNLYSDVNGDKLLADSIYRYDVGERGLRPAENGEIRAEHIKFLRLVADKSLKTISQIGGINEIIGNCLFLTLEHAAI